MTFLCVSRWHEMKKNHKLSFNWGFLEFRSSPRLLKPYLPNLEADIKKLTVGIGSGDATLVASVLLQKRDFCRVKAVFPPQYGVATRRVSSRGPVLTPMPLFGYKYLLVSEQRRRRKVFRISFFSFSSLVHLLLFLLYFFFLLDLVKVKR